MSNLILFNKPFDVLCQFTDESGRATLADFIPMKGYYPAGRLDRDSEGLVLLTNDGRLQHLISHPKHKMDKTYWVQVEGEIDNAACQRLLQGVQLKDGPARAKRATIIEQPNVWPRNPPVRERKFIPTSWLQMVIDEGRNRQVRRMTAAVGFPTLRLIRYAIGEWTLDDVAPGQWKELVAEETMLQDLTSTNWRRPVQRKKRSHSPRKSSKKPTLR